MNDSVPRTGIRLKLWTLLVLVATGPSVRAEIIPGDRRIAWLGAAGLVGGIPDVTTVYTNFASPPTLAALASALGSCPSNQVVKLGVWTNTFGSDLVLSRNGVVLRGTTDALGRPLTKIIFSGGRLILRAPAVSTASMSVEVDLSADAIKGATNLSMAAVPSWVKLGELFILDELDDPALISGAGHESGRTYREIEGNGPRGKAQLVKVKAKTATTVSLELPVNETYRVNQTAQLSGSAYNTASGQTSLKRAGFEDLRIEFTYTNAAGEGIKIENGDSCWMRNVTSSNCPGTYHLWNVFSYRCEIRHCEFGYGQLYDGGHGYGITLYHYTTASLYEDNIIRHTHAGMTVNYGSSGNVFGYNYIADGFSTSHQEPAISAHGVSTWQCLFEGNYCHNKVLFDYTHGSGGTHHTLFRNRILGLATASGDQVPISLERYNRGHNIIGNILGVAGTQTAYARMAPAVCSGGTPIFRLGYFNNSTCDVTNYDTPLIQGTLIHANYDVVTTTNNGIVWDAATPDRTLPDSYYLAGKPVWFGSLNWPPFRPSSPGAATVTNIPAGYRAVFGSDPPFISLVRSGRNSVITWFGGTLQQSDRVTGPFTNVPEATSPYTATATTTNQFFRAR